MMRFGLVSLLALAFMEAGLCGVSAQTPPSAQGADRGELRLHAVLSGAVQPGEVTLLDNGAPVTTAPLKSPGSEPVHVILVIDDVNARLTTIAYERNQLKSFFLRNDGQLRVPFTLAVMTDTNLNLQRGFSQNGNTENEVLQSFNIGLHDIHADSQWGHLDRTNLCVQTLAGLVDYAAKIPGRKLILFVSPGWPLLSGPRVNLSSKEEQSIYATVAGLQDSMLRANVTLDMLNPFGPGESIFRDSYYESFLKGVRKPGDVDLADLSLQVLTVHSGGRVVQGTSDIAGMVDHALAELDETYELDFTPRPAEKPGEFHHLELRVAGAGIQARIPDEYYGEPAAAGTPR